ncbi:hypothetical protein HaLaN_31469, partial [Haematococcus lacustris]
SPSDAKKALASALFIVSAVCEGVRAVRAEARSLWTKQGCHQEAPAGCEGTRPGCWCLSVRGHVRQTAYPLVPPAPQTRTSPPLSASWTLHVALWPLSLTIKEAAYQEAHRHENRHIRIGHPAAHQVAVRPGLSLQARQGAGAQGSVTSAGQGSHHQGWCWQRGGEAAGSEDPPPWPCGPPASHQHS